MLTIRTDLAAEAHALWQESAGETTALPGVRAREGELEGFPLTWVEAEWKKLCVKRSVSMLQI